LRSVEAGEKEFGRNETTALPSVRLRHYKLFFPRSSSHAQDREFVLLARRILPSPKDVEFDRLDEGHREARIDVACFLSGRNDAAGGLADAVLELFAADANRLRLKVFFEVAATDGGVDEVVMMHRLSPPPNVEREGVDASAESFELTGESQGNLGEVEGRFLTRGREDLSREREEERRRRMRVASEDDLGANGEADLAQSFGELRRWERRN
jgi:hypothetical protein